MQRQKRFVPEIFSASKMRPKFSPNFIFSWKGKSRKKPVQFCFLEPSKSNKGVEVNIPLTFKVMSLLRNSSIFQISRIQLKFQISERPKWRNTVAQNFSSRISRFCRMESQTVRSSLLQISGTVSKISKKNY